MVDRKRPEIHLLMLTLELEAHLQSVSIPLCIFSGSFKLASTIPDNHFVGVFFEPQRYSGKTFGGKSK